MSFTTLKLSGTTAIEALESHRHAYPQTGKYPFLIGDSWDLELVRDAVEYDHQDCEELVRDSLSLDLSAWLRERRAEFEECGFSEEELLGKWPGEIADKGEISLHRDLESNQPKLEVYMGLAKISQPWQLPAILNYGGWNGCPEPEVQCAFHRQWQSEFGAEIVGMSSDAVECIVANPPRDEAAAMKLAWQHYWYCAEIVEQGCQSVSNLAATLINSKYWLFWWD